MIGLVIPKALWRFVARRDDPFDPDAVALLKNGGEFLRQVLGRLARRFIESMFCLAPISNPRLKVPIVLVLGGHQ